MRSLLLITLLLATNVNASTPEEDYDRGIRMSMCAIFATQTLDEPDIVVRSMFIRFWMQRTKTKETYNKLLSMCTKIFIDENKKRNGHVPELIGPST